MPFSCVLERDSKSSSPDKWALYPILCDEVSVRLFVCAKHLEPCLGHGGFRRNVRSLFITCELQFDADLQSGI